LPREKGKQIAAVAALRNPKRLRYRIA
jgi:hypothetical protein